METLRFRVPVEAKRQQLMKNSNFWNRFEVYKVFHKGLVSHQTWLWKLHGFFEREPKRLPALEVIHELP